jgi:hypothetical protein
MYGTEWKQFLNRGYHSLLHRHLVAPVGADTVTQRIDRWPTPSARIGTLKTNTNARAVQGPINTHHPSPSRRFQRSFHNALIDHYYFQNDPKRCGPLRRSRCAWPVLCGTLSTLPPPLCLRGSSERHRPQQRRRLLQPLHESVLANLSSRRQSQRPL